MDRMVKRTKQEIDRLAEDIAAEWKAASPKAYTGNTKARALSLIFTCLPGSQDDYKEGQHG